MRCQQAVGRYLSPRAGGGRLDHLRDVGRGIGGNAVEVLEMRLANGIVAVVPVAYSAQSNGAGSFFEHRVTIAVDNGEGAAVPPCRP